MRICFFGPDENILNLDTKVVSEDLGKFKSNDKLDEIYFVTYLWPKPGKFAKNLYVLVERERFRVKICCKLFKIMDRSKWIPAFLAIFPLLLCKKEIGGTLLGCDPDVVILPNLRWGHQLTRLLRRYFPSWVCLSSGIKGSCVAENWRKYDERAKVSIVLPTYNGSKYISKSIESCLKQTHKNIELIIVDDGSSENVEEIVNSHKDVRIKYQKHETNLGVSKALNSGFQMSTGDYLTWTSDDNYYAPNAIEEMVTFLQTYPGIDFVYAESYAIDENDKVQRIQRNKTSYYLKFDNSIGGCFLYKRKVYETVGEYNPRVFLAEDYEYWLRVSRTFKMQPIFRQLYSYRFHKDSLTSKYGRENVLEKVKLAKTLNKVNHLFNIRKYLFKDRFVLGKRD